MNFDAGIIFIKNANDFGSVKLIGVIAIHVLAAVVNCDVEKTAFYGINDYVIAAQPRGTNVTDGALCEINIASTWLDLVLVLEATSIMAYQWPALNANTSDHGFHADWTSRIAVITYDSSSVARQHFYFTDRQDLKNIYFALHAAKPNGTGSKGNIASGFRLAHEHLNKICFAATVALINCRCPSGWTQFVTGNTTYADCFQNRDHLAGCDNGTILAVANTPARFNFIIQLALNWTTVPTNEINIGLTRSDANSPWIWKDGQAYNATAFPAFAKTPSETDIYGYLSKKDNYHWQLLSDDCLATRNSVCQRHACDSSNICDLNI